jgi:hypothetical protein
MIVRPQTASRSVLLLSAGQYRYTSDVTAGSRDRNALALAAVGFLSATLVNVLRPAPKPQNLRARETARTRFALLGQADMIIHAANIRGVAVVGLPTELA